jgi:hypothetical protein
VRCHALSKGLHARLCAHTPFKDMQYMWLYIVWHQLPFCNWLTCCCCCCCRPADQHCAQHGAAAAAAAWPHLAALAGLPGGAAAAAAVTRGGRCAHSTGCSAMRQGRPQVCYIVGCCCVL